MLFGFFFAMRSCENVRVQGTERRTKPIMKRNLVFLKEGKILPHDHLFLETAVSVTVNFEYQKRNDRDDQVTQCATEHSLFYPEDHSTDHSPSTRDACQRRDPHLHICPRGWWMGDGVTSTPVRHLLSYVISSPTRGGHLVCTGMMLASTPFVRRQQWQCT
jgi:hypothetical protein